MLATAWASLITLMFFILSVLSLKADNDVERARVRDAFASGVVQGDDNAFLTGNTDIGAHQWNDCLVLHQVLDRRAMMKQLIISPLEIAPSAAVTSPCADTAALASGQSITPPPGFYHRYIHGHTVLARLLLSELSVSNLRHLYSGMIVLMLMIGIARTIISMTKGQRVEEGCFWLVTFFVFARFFGIESFGQSLAHGPADIVIVGFMLFLANCSSQGGMDARRVPAAAAVFGALTIIFEFLTGGIPIGLAVLIGALPFALRPPHPSKRETLVRPVVLAAVAFVIAIVVVIAIKSILILAIFGSGTFGATFQELLFRMGLAEAPVIGAAYRPGYAALFNQVVGNLDALAAGERLMALLMICISWSAGIWATRKLVRMDCSLSRERAIALSCSNIVIVGWILAFSQHTAQHARFMDRILVWTISSGISLFALAMIHGAGRQSVLLYKDAHHACGDDDCATPTSAMTIADI